jgi:DNA replication and repair protein RecF
MRINSLILTNFRNHAKLELAFEHSTTLIQGINGSGKTNILEAIHLLSTTKSVRSEYDSETIMHTKDFCRLEAQTDSGEDSKRLELIIKKSSTLDNTSSKTVKINGVAKALHRFAGTMTSVLFSPDEITILTGSPSMRRRYIDSILYQIDTDYKQAHTKYQKALKGRNKLLEMIRETGKGQNLIDLWEENLCTEARIIQTKRAALFKYLTEEIRNYEKLINGKNSKITLELIQSLIDKDFLKQSRQKEIYAGKTLYGPHRDDFRISLNDYSVSNFASRGQQRAVLLALKFCELSYIQKSVGSKPLLLLDDIFSELDLNHRTNILSIIGNQQTIVTSSEELPELRQDFNHIIQL